MNFFFNFSQPDFLPQGEAYQWQTEVLWMNVIGDAATAIAYFCIPLLLLFFLSKRSDIQHPHLFLAISIFLMVAGTAHTLSVVSVWDPVYHLEGLVKLTTAAVSFGTVVMLLVRFRDVLAIPTNMQLRELNEKLQREVAQREQTLANLQQTRQSLVFLINHSPVPMALLDRQGNWLEVNDSYCNMLGYSREEMLRKDFRTVTHPDDLPRDLEYVGRFLSGEVNESRWQKRYVHRDGHPVWVILNLTMLRDLGQQQEHFVAQATDISQQLETQRLLTEKSDLLERTVSERTAALTQTNADMENFLYAVTHDLRLPLKNMEGLTEVVEEELQTGKLEEIPSLIEMQRINLKRMDSLMTDLLAFSRVGQQSLTRSPLDMNQQARAAYSSCIMRYADKEVSFECLPLPPAHGDPSAVQLVWDNLIANALKYSGHRSHIQIQVGGRREADFNIYYVSDNGVGFDEQYAHKLFGLFQRLHTEQGFEGTGLGLALVQRVIEKHGGAVWAESRIDEGSTFYFSLPHH